MYGSSTFCFAEVDLYPIPLFEFYTIFSFSNSSFFSLFCFEMALNSTLILCRYLATHGSFNATITVCFAALPKSSISMLT